MQNIYQRFIGEGHIHGRNDCKDDAFACNKTKDPKIFLLFSVLLLNNHLTDLQVCQLYSIIRAESGDQIDFYAILKSRKTNKKVLKKGAGFNCRNAIVPLSDIVGLPGMFASKFGRNSLKKTIITFSECGQSTMADLVIVAAVCESV